MLDRRLRSRDVRIVYQPKVCFFLEDEEFGLDILSVQEILTVPHITRVFHTPPFVVGLINLRGNIVAVVDMAMFFGLGRTDMSMKDARIIVVRGAGRTAGIVAERVASIRRINPTKIEPAPQTLSGVESQYISGIYELADHPLILLDVDRMISSEDFARL